MRIALAHPAAPYYRTGDDPLNAGVTVYVRGLSEALVQAGHEVTVFAPDTSHENGLPPFSGEIEYELGGVRVVLFRGAFPSIEFSYRLSHYLMKYPHDVLEAHNWAYAPVVDQIVGGTPTVVRFASDLYSQAEVGKFPLFDTLDRQLRMTEQLLEEFSLNNADLVLAASQKMVLRAARMGIHAVEIPLGFDRIPLPDVDRDHVMVMVGRFQDARKGGEYAMDFVSAIPEECAVTVIGSVWPPSQREEVLASIPDRDGLRVVLDPLLVSELAEMYNRTKTVIVPSVSESFGMVFLEPLAYGCSVVAFIQDDASKKEWPMYWAGEPSHKNARGSRKAIEAALASSGHEEVKFASKYRWSELLPQYERAYERAIASAFMKGRRRGW